MRMGNEAGQTQTISVRTPRTHIISELEGAYGSADPSCPGTNRETEAWEEHSCPQAQGIT